MPGKGRHNDTAPRTAGGNAYPYRDGFEPTSVGAEKEAAGWLRTTAPEGAAPEVLHELHTAGSRGSEMTARHSVARTTRRLPDGGGDADEADG